MLASRSSSTWKKVLSGASQNLSLAVLMLFNILSMTCVRAEGVLVKGTDNTKLGGAANTLEERKKILKS